MFLVLFAIPICVLLCEVAGNIRVNPVEFALQSITENAGGSGQGDDAFSISEINVIVS